MSSGLSNALVYLLQCREEIRQKPNWVVISFVERQPGVRTFHAAQPFRDQRGLAEPSLGGNERQLAIQNSIELLDQARAQHERGPDRRDIEFCGQQWRGHLTFPEVVARRFPRAILP
jgi:hypothetical protein